MESKDKERLVHAALQARAAAVAPYSRFPVGAALLTNAGAIVTGANVESASFGLSCCAERVALFKALTSGHKDFLALAVAASVRGGVRPCGACRQLLIEYAPQATLWLIDADRPEEVYEFSIKQMLPEAFTDVPSLSAGQDGQKTS
ncbi:MAG: cytidine deaminase [Verrucomicrobiota bacterium]